MNTSHRPHASDEVLSALLDGFDEEEARAHVAECEVCGARLEELDRARALVAAPVDPVDEMTRRRLVSEALAASSQRTVRAQRRLAVLGVAALAALVVVAVPLLSGDGGGDGDLSASGEESVVPEGAFVGNLGRLDQPTAVRDAMGGSALLSGPGGVGAGAGGSSGAGTVAESGDDSAGTRTGAQDAAPKRSAADAEAAPSPPSAFRVAGGSLPRAVERCARSVQSAEPSPSGQLVLAATGTFAEQKAVVLAYREDRRVFALILARADCSILTTQSFDVP